MPRQLPEDLNWHESPQAAARRAVEENANYTARIATQDDGYLRRPVHVGAQEISAIQEAFRRDAEAAHTANQAVTINMYPYWDPYIGYVETGNVGFTPNPDAVPDPGPGATVDDLGGTGGTPTPTSLGHVITGTTAEGEAGKDTVPSNG